MNRPTLDIKNAFTENRGREMRPSSHWGVLCRFLHVDDDARTRWYWDHEGPKPEIDQDKQQVWIESLGNIVSNFVALDIYHENDPIDRSEDLEKVAQSFAEAVRPPLNTSEKQKFVDKVIEHVPVAVSAHRAVNEEGAFGMAVFETIRKDADAALTLWSAVEGTDERLGDPDTGPDNT